MLNSRWEVTFADGTAHEVTPLPIHWTLAERTFKIPLAQFEKELSLDFICHVLWSATKDAELHDAKSNDDFQRRFLRDLKQVRSLDQQSPAASPESSSS